jgi:hypothetical protein
MKTLRFDSLEILKQKNGRNGKSEKAALYHTSNKLFRLYALVRVGFRLGAARRND